MFEQIAGAMGFLHAIREAPDEPGNWLVFADWLEDHGEPRAFWLRDPNVRNRLTPDLRDPVPALLAELECSYEAQELLIELGPCIVEAVRVWTRENDADRFQDSVSVLRQVRPLHLRGVAELIVALKSKSWYERWQAVIDLGFHGPEAAPAVGALLEVDTSIGYDDGNILAEEIISVLAKLGSAATLAIPKLYKWLGGHEHNVREAAAAALDKIGPYAPDRMLAELKPPFDSDYSPENALQALVNSHPERYAVLARVLRGEVQIHDAMRLVSLVLTKGDYGRPPRLTAEEVNALVPELIEALKRPVHKYHDDRTDAGKALIAIGPRACAALHALRVALVECLTGQVNHYNAHYTSNTLATAVARLGDIKTAFAVLLPDLSSKCHHTRGNALLRLGRTGVLEALPHVLAGLRDPDTSNDAREAMNLLVNEDSDPTAFVPPLLKALKDRSQEVSSQASGSAVADAECAGRRPCDPRNHGCSRR